MAEGLVGMAPAALAGACSFREAFRGRQVYRWLSAGAKSFELMTDLPRAERERLSKLFPSIYTSMPQAEIEDADGSLKLQIRLADGALIECVVLEDIEDRKTACLSCQAGCPMGCTFCKTGSLGYLRDLSSAEILEQFHELNRKRGPISNIVFMGMGEPLANLDAVRAAISILIDPAGVGISRRKVTISTCGLVPGILDLAQNGPAVRLAVSLTCADDTLRSELMPINRRYGLQVLKEALLSYQAATKERITIEAALMGDRNCGSSDAEAMVRWIRPLDVQVNLIPWNRIPGFDFIEPTKEQLETFQSILEHGGIVATRRMRRGRGVMAACGQLGDTGIL